MYFTFHLRSAVLASVFFFSSGIEGAFSYTLTDAYVAQNLADTWSFFDQADPTHGFVQYVSSQAAQASLLASKTTDGNIYLGTGNGTNGRQSVRVSTKKTYKYHLMIADIVHAPQGSGAGGSCGLWPALWELGGPQWPNDGEIDIYEGVNAQTANQMTLHTGPNCQVTNNQQTFSGNMTTTDCNVSNGANGNAGCSVQSQGTNSASSFGTGFNAVGGGVYAVEVATTGIKIWHFPRSAIPQDISQGSKNPDPSTWGLPDAAFAGGCDIDQHFQNLSIVINTAFCGDWAGKVWNNPQAGGQPSCAQMTGASTCEAYVAANPDAFSDAYWEIKSINVYTPGATPGATATTTTTPIAAATSAIPVTDDVTVPVPVAARMLASRVSRLLADPKAINKREPDATVNIFSQPTGDALANCNLLTPGHCGQQLNEVQQSSSGAATLPPFNKALMTVASALAAFYLHI